ncbi:MAG: hypothetical protein DHS20C16_27580 [Phycisphaerae bacterium]|nr:MAG: hypothetical protein DHS20C16_27580 [Phycisphaerae bacterium]
MRKLLAVALLAAFAVPASAATLSLRFAGLGATNDTNAEITSVGGSVQVEVWMEFTDASDAGNGVGGASFNLTAAPESADAGLQGDLVEEAGLGMSGNATGNAGWSAADVPGNVGGLSQFSVFAGLPSDGIVSGGADVLLGTFNITGNAIGSYQFWIQRDGLVSPSVGFANGAPYGFNGDGDGYAGNFNIGNGYAGALKGQNNIPMNINVTPEPAALALLALGGVAVLRRRS